MIDVFYNMCYDVLIELYKRVVNETSQEMFIVDKKFIGLYYKLKF